MQEALQHLAKVDADLRRALKQVGPPPPRHRPAGFETLPWIIVGQQISIKAADAIGNRLVAALDPPTPRPTPKALRAMAGPWRPWRSVAARLPWHYYGMAPVEA